ncbi:LysR family transcriptional regulator [Hylemonella gracilis]|uniref:LysR family transcriptional regulator n=1 Tax=Hylemonella gracilis TaxID=80880 RepID=A0A4P6UGN9_9BURK|nr:LysR family transcriptional regulator [Hylemonella gracilis]QBK03566.1 LysR family transcriptional regulator [Hylemonella gracilis]
MEFRHLRYFVTVAETGHMTRAAERLGIQQPPLSQQIRALEDRLGVRLLRRHPKGVDLTDEGRLFLDEARRLLADAEALTQRMARIARGELGRLSVGFTSSAATHAFTPRALRECRRRFPDLALDLSEANAAELTEALAAGRLHAAFVRVPVAHPPGVDMHTLLREPVVVALPLDHPLAAGDEPLALRALDGQLLILVRRPGAPGLYANLLALCAREGVQPRVVAEVERMLSNLNLVAAGAGLSVVPESMRGTHVHAIRYRALAAGPELEAPLTLMVRAGEAQGALATFVALVRELAAAPEPA